MSTRGSPLSTALFVCVTLSLSSALTFGVTLKNALAAEPQPLSTAQAISPSALHRATPQNRFALVIGANRGHADEETLRYAENDATRVAQVLSKFGQVNPERMILMHSPTPSEVRRSFSDLRQRIQTISRSGPPLLKTSTRWRDERELRQPQEESQRGDDGSSVRAEKREVLLIIYYSGHADASSMHLGYEAFSFKELKRLSKETGAQLKIFLIDACRSGAFTRLKGAKPAQSFKIQAEDQLDVEGVAVISSASADEDAQESEQLKGGVFTQHLIAGLIGAADQSADQRISLSELYQYTYRETLKSTSKTRHVQHPSYSFQMRGRDDLMLTRLNDLRGFAQVSLQTNGGYLLIPERGSGPMIEASPDQKTTLLVEPGEYQVYFRSKRSLFEGKVDLKSGRTYPLDVSDLNQVPYGVSVRRGASRSGGIQTVNTSAWALTAGGLWLRPLRPSMSDRIGGQFGVSRHGTLFTQRLTFSWAESESDASERIGLSQRELGLSLSFIKHLDLAYISFGFGLTSGLSSVTHTFDEVANTEDRASLISHLSPLAQIGTSLGPRLYLNLEGGPSLWLFPGEEGLEEVLGWSAQLNLEVYLTY